MESHGARVVFPLEMPEADTIKHEGQTVISTSCKSTVEIHRESSEG